MNIWENRYDVNSGFIENSGLVHGSYCPLIACERGSSGSIGSEGSAGVVRRIKNQKRRGVLKYAVFTKDGKPVNLLNLQNLLTYEAS